MSFNSLMSAVGKRKRHMEGDNEGNEDLSMENESSTLRDRSMMDLTRDTPPHKVHIGQKELKTVPREYQQRIHSLEQDVKLKEDIIIEREKSIGTLQEALKDALDRSSAKETQLQGSQHAALQLLERIKELEEEVIVIGENFTTKHSDLTEAYSKKDALVTQLETECADFKKERNSILKSIELHVAEKTQLNTKIASLEVKLKNNAAEETERTHRLQTLQNEKAILESEAQDYQKQAKTLHSQLQELNKTIVQKDNQLDTLKNQLDEAKEADEVELGLRTDWDDQLNERNPTLLAQQTQLKDKLEQALTNADQAEKVKMAQWLTFEAEIKTLQETVKQKDDLLNAKDDGIEELKRHKKGMLATMLTLRTEAGADLDLAKHELEKNPEALAVIIKSNEALLTRYDQEITRNAKNFESQIRVLHEQLNTAKSDAKEAEKSLRSQVEDSKTREKDLLNNNNIEVNRQAERIAELELYNREIFDTLLSLQTDAKIALNELELAKNPKALTLIVESNEALLNAKQNRIQDLENDLAAMKEALNKSTINSRDLQADLDDIRKSSKTLRSQLDELKRQKAAWQIKERTRENNGPNFVARATYDAMIRRYDNLQTTLQETEKSYKLESDAATEELREQKEELERLRQVETTYTAVLNQMEQLQNSYSVTKNELSRLQNNSEPDALKALEGVSLRKQVEIETLEKEVTSLRAKARAYAPPSSAFRVQLPEGQVQTQGLGTGIPMNGNPAHDIHTVGGMGFTLSKAPVAREFRHVQRNYPQWHLPATVSPNAQKPWDNVKGSKFTVRTAANAADDNGHDGDVELGSNGSTPGQNRGEGSDRAGPSGKGKGKAPDRGDPPDGGDSSDDDGHRPSRGPRIPHESIGDRLTKEWKRHETKASYTPAHRRRNHNRLGRDLIKEAFGVKRLYAIFAKNTAKADEIQRFEAGVSSGPSLNDAQIDKHGESVLMLKRSAWNRQILRLLVEEAEKIALQFLDGRFDEAFDWKGLFAERMCRVFRDEINGRRRPGESHEERVFRLLTEHDKEKERKGQTSIRHLKYETRSDVATVMIRACQERGDQMGVEFWTYVLAVLGHLRHEGMSDEENAEVPVQYDGGLVRQQPIKKIPILWWRHPWLLDLFKIVDSATIVERILFHRAGAKRIQRIRVHEVQHRLPPSGLPKSLFREDYLESMLPVDRDDLKILETHGEQFPLYNFVGYDPNRDTEANVPGSGSGSGSGNSGSGSGSGSGNSGSGLGSGGFRGH